MLAVSKVIVTHYGAAKAKYGTSGWTRIRRAISALVTEDKKRGIATSLFLLDRTSHAGKVGGVAVGAAGDARAVKALIDAVFKTLEPAYLVLLGGPELVPQVELVNPLWSGDPNDDPDQFTASDLPYACDAPFATSGSAYRGPTRVVGRIPDLTGVTDPTSLLSQLRSSAKATTAPRPGTVAIFVLSTKTWHVSTELSLGKLPAIAGGVHTCPTEGPVWDRNDLSPRIHFVNCHGGEFDPTWYGEATPGQQTVPPAMQARLLANCITPGTVVGAECCYGAALWPPAAAAGQPGLAQTYLMEGAGGVFAASNTSYGPAAANEYADVLCRLFCEEVLSGASIGRAALSARQRFVQGQSFLDPTDLKTLAQFVLLGDPSYQPFDAVGPASGPGPSAHAGPPGTSVTRQGVASGVLSRRRMLSSVGRALTASATVTSDLPQQGRTLTRTRLAAVLGAQVPAGTAIRSFAARPPPAAGPGAGTPVAHVAFVRRSRSAPRSLVVVREEADGQTELRLAVRR